MDFREGVININKPSGWTSQDVCAKLRHRLHIRKIGHTGTLDPMATGVLPVCIGRATRAIEYYDRDRKSYHASMQLGLTSDTLDITGEISEESSFDEVKAGDVERCFAAYTGDVVQIPPKYSALKVNGRRAYDLAREGRSFSLEGRKITIYSMSAHTSELGRGLVSFDVTCSKGTYIRTICDDIGRALGCGAVMTSLERTSSGVFNVKDSIGIEEICMLGDEDLADHIIPVDETLVCLGRVSLRDHRYSAFINGNNSEKGYEVTMPSSFSDVNGMDYYRIYSRGRFLGIGGIRDNILYPVKVMEL